MPATQPCLSSLAWLERPLNVWGQNHIPRSTHSCLVVFLWFSRAPWRMNPRGRSQHSPVSSPKAESLFVTWYSEETVPHSAGSLSRETQVGDFKTKFLDACGEAPPPPQLLPDLLSNRGMIYTDCRLYHFYVGSLCFYKLNFFLVILPVLPLIIPFSFDFSSGAEMRLKCNLKMLPFQHHTTGLLHLSESALYDS